MYTNIFMHGVAQANVTFLVPLNMRIRTRNRERIHGRGVDTVQVGHPYGKMI